MDEEAIQRQRNLRNGVHINVARTPAEQRKMEKSAALRAEECRASERETELGTNELCAVFGTSTSSTALAVLARVCWDWRLAASHVRSDICWQLEHLSVVNGVPETLRLPRSRERLRRWVTMRPDEACAFLSYAELRLAEAPEALVVRRLDFDDGLRIPVAVSSAEAKDAALRALRVAATARASAGESDDLLPAPCTLVRDGVAATDGIGVSVAGVCVGRVAPAYAAAIDDSFDDARLVDVGCFDPYRWKILCVPAPPRRSGSPPSAVVPLA